MRLCIFRRCAMWAAVAALLCGAAGQAVAQVLGRSLLGATLRNDGRDGGPIGSPGQTRLAYPRNWEVPGDEAPPSGQTRGPGDQVVGHGFFILTRQGGKYQTVWTGPRPMPPAFGQIVPMQYNPKTDGPEAHLGTEAFFLRGREYRIGNWYPGREPLNPREPVGLVIENHRFREYTPDDTFPEQIVLNKWTTSQGITFVRKAYAWSYPDFDDFIIQEMEFTNTGDSNGDGVRDLPTETLSPVYISIVQFFVAGAHETETYVEFFYQLKDRNNDDWLVYSDAPSYPLDRYGREGKRVPPGLKLLFSYDDDHPNTPYDDRGGPLYFDYLSQAKKLAGVAVQDGQLVGFQFIGLAPLAFSNKGPFAFAGRDAGKTYVEPEGDQPSSVRWYRSYDPSTQDDPNPQLHTAQKMQEMLTGKIEDTPKEVGSFFSAQTYGPYTLAPGATGKLVFAYVAGAAPQMLNQDMITWSLKGNKDELSLGQDAMLQNLEAARFAYRQAFDVPDAPPDVAFEESFSPNAHMVLTWSNQIENASNPDYTGAEAKDVIGYRVYRSTWLGVGPWELISEVKKGSASGGTYTFEDTQSVPGFIYLYSVRAVAGGHQTWTNGRATLTDLPKHIQEHVRAGFEGGGPGRSRGICRESRRSSPPLLKRTGWSGRCGWSPTPSCKSRERRTGIRAGIGSDS